MTQKIILASHCHVMKALGGSLVVVLTCRCFHFSGLIKPLLMTAWVWANSAPGTWDSPVHPPGWSCWWQTWLFFLTASLYKTFDAGCEISCFLKPNEFILELREQKLCNCTETTVNCLWSTNQNLSIYLIQKPPLTTPSTHLQSANTMRNRAVKQSFRFYIQLKSTTWIICLPSQWQS